MPGERQAGADLALVAPDASTTARLVRALALLHGDDFDRFCLVGGLAVLSRVGRLYRVTADVDTVVEDDGVAIAALRSRPTARPTTNGVRLGDTEIDVIEVGTIDDPEQLPDDPLDRAFVLSHRFALDTAAPVAIVVCAPDGGDEVARAEVDVATPAALVAMKLG